jgi:2-polyprenyl-3-methyl-5-hydroxy-6-metoxy-1,4-benzoquinol methylase
MKNKTKEPQYSILYDIQKKYGISRFGIMANESWNSDPKRTLFTLSRYKFVSKMFSEKKHALEIGCADAFGTRLIKQTVKNVTAIDFDPLFIDDAKQRNCNDWKINLFVHDILKSPLENKKYDCAFSLDVLEHINKANEKRFIINIKNSIKNGSPVIFGMPSLESQKYASPQSKEGHVNCKTGDDFKNTLLKHFDNVFIFSMNDEVLHTGFFPMSNYLFALCV